MHIKLQGQEELWCESLTKKHRITAPNFIISKNNLKEFHFLFIPGLRLQKVIAGNGYRIHTTSLSHWNLNTLLPWRQNEHTFGGLCIYNMAPRLINELENFDRCQEILFLNSKWLGIGRNCIVIPCLLRYFN